MSSRKKKKRTKIIVLAILLTISIIVAGCYWAYRFLDLENDPNTVYAPNRTYAENYYGIDSKTILTDLGNGNTDVFEPLLESPEETINDEPIVWNQSDYFNVAVVFHQFVTGDSVEDWKLYKLYFSAYCHEDFDGFEFGEISFFKPEYKYGRPKGYEYRGYVMSSSNGYVASGNLQFFPYKNPEWQGIDLNDITIKAEEAFHIADRNGGQSIRMSVKNQCRISVMLHQDQEIWDIRVDDLRKGQGGITLFSIGVDPYTGEITEPQIFAAHIATDIQTCFRRVL